MKTGSMNGYSAFLVVGFGVVVACAGGKRTVEAGPAPTVLAATQVAPARTSSGTVVETMNSGGYTYVHVDTGAEKRWVAAPQTEVAVGDEVVIPQGVEMGNFRSNTLGRTFEVLHLVGSIEVKGSKKPATPVHGSHGGSKAAAQAVEVELGSITKAEGGKTVGQLFEEKADLAGTAVTVRGKVVKFSPAIMGKNWIHVQDGTGAAGANNLVVTTDGVTNVGDTVRVTGVLSVDRDLGFGYKYEVLVEDAQIKVE